MKPLIIVAFLICLSSCNDESKSVKTSLQKALSQKIDDSKIKFTSSISFIDFKTQVETFKSAQIDLISNKSGKKFQTQISDNYDKSETLFAGHYSLISWGCGSPCQMSVIVDRKTGKIYDAPNASLGYQFRADSKMLIVNPPDSKGYYGKCSYCNPEIYILDEKTKVFNLKDWR